MTHSWRNIDISQLIHKPAFCSITDSTGWAWQRHLREETVARVGINEINGGFELSSPLTYIATSRLGFTSAWGIMIKCNESTDEFCIGGVKVLLWEQQFDSLSSLGCIRDQKETTLTGKSSAEARGSILVYKLTSSLAYIDLAKSFSNRLSTYTQGS